MKEKVPSSRGATLMSHLGDSPSLMNVGKRKKRIIRNGVLVSLMMFYFSCGKDVFPPDPPENFPGYAMSPAPSLLFLSPFSFDLSLEL